MNTSLLDLNSDITKNRKSSIYIKNILEERKKQNQSAMDKIYNNRVPDKAEFV
jgi:hypothetical protein